MSANQQPVGIDAVGGAGHQGAVVLPLRDFQRGGILRLHDEDLIHLIGQNLIQHPQEEGIPLPELVQVGEQLGAGQTPVTGEDAVGTLPAHRQAGPFQMAHGHL